MFVSTSCADDRYLIDDPAIGEGEAKVTAEVSFKNFTPALEGSRAAGTPGGDLNSIDNLYVFIYDANGNLVNAPIIYNKGNEGFNITTNTEVPSDGEGVDTDKDGKVSTDKASFSFPLPYGKYHIYAAANIRGDYATALSNPEGVVKTEDGLKSYQVKWNSTTIGDNDQMFGYFMALEGDNTTAPTSKEFGPVDVIVNKPNIKLSAWLRRLASKVTVAYDASGLNNGVWIYIKNVTVHDIAAECYLGQANDPQTSAGVLNRRTGDANKPGVSYTPSEANTRIDYPGSPQNNIYDKSQTGLELYNGLITVDGKPIILGSDHKPGANGLFFYENMKGNFDGDPKKHKRPQGKGDDQVGENVRDDDGANDYQDRVPYGTYIEVEGYYVSLNHQNPGEGAIKYRFMLGKDVDFDYNVERNYHYKLTLGFKGWANQPDWHIDFDNTPPILDVPPVYRVSYLYQQHSTLPVKVSDNCTGLRVEIVENNWAPSDPNTYEFPSNPASQVTNTSLKAYYDFFWNKDAFDNYYSSFETVKNVNGESMRINTKMPWLGFLALNMPLANDVAELDVTIPLKGETNGVKNYYAYKDGVAGQNALKDFYDEKRGMGSQGYSEYGRADLTLGGQDVHHSDCPLNAYSVVSVDDGSTSNDRIVMVNMWTRARTMIENAGFSGNNPYEYFVRRATLKVTATFEAEDPADQERTTYVTVLQEPRIVNPKAVWRKSGSTAGPFHVLLMTADGSNQKADYTPLKSDGEWTAEVEIGSNITLTKSATTLGEEKEGKIYGRTGTEVDFNINFNGDGCAVINVKYHNNNCYHKILVRQGYDGTTELGDNEWSNFTLQSATARPGEANAYNAELTASPFYLGSLYRMGRITKGILETNNARTGDGIYGIGPLEQPTNRQYNLTDGTTASWVGLGNGGSNTDPSPMGTFYLKNGDRYKVPELEDFNKLKLNCEFALGIIYGEATETATNFEDATGYWIDDSEDANKVRGVRGVIAYDAKNSTGRQVLFSLGKDGFGRRKYAADDNAKRGMLIYSDVDFFLTGDKPNAPTAASPGNVFRPVVYNLKISPGAIFWLNNRVANGYLGNTTPSPTMSWDVNYFNYDFNSFDNGDNTNWRDANLIKLIKVK